MAPDTTTTTTAARTGRPRTSTSPQAVDLLHQAQAGNSEAFAELYRLYRDLIIRVVWVRVHHRDAVDDLVHDTFTDALATLATADDDVVAWLLRLAAYACNRHLWANRGHLRAAHELHAQPFPTAGPAPDPQRINLLAALIAAAPLTVDQRQALQLRLDGYPRHVAAAQMGRTRHAVKCLEWDAVRRLRSIADGAL
ncbi:MAG: polymerase sigma-70 factor, subfamily [Micromonosporaceae bacterium]|jgi:RNA polymerase sigma-70 factor (ECF subfamily)|nr:polymerase sigma-70 factor, subfamily [Micromonosporaceae bacterium]